MSQIRMPRREVSIPEEDSDSDGSDNNGHPVAEPRRRPSRISFSKLWKFSVLSVSPSPRVSTIDSPTGLYGKDHVNELQRIERRNVVICRVAFCLMLIVAIILTILTVQFAISASEIPYCQPDTSDYITPRDLQNPDVFDDITTSEYQAVAEYLLKFHTLGLVAYENATLTDSYIFLIELHMPAKNETIQYLDEGSKKPDRIAKAVIYRGNHDPPTVVEYLVFPLSEPIHAVPYKDPTFRTHPIPFHSRPMDFKEESTLHRGILSNVTEDIYPLLIESYNLCYHNCTKGLNCIEIMEVAMLEKQSKSRKSWFRSFQLVDGFYLHPLGLEFLIDHTSTNTSEWVLDLVQYNGKTFPSTSSLMEAFKSAKIMPIRIHPENNDNDNSYSTFEAKDPITDHRQGPFLFEPEGKRFKVLGQRIIYNKWAFRYHLRPSNGIMLFDIKFNDMRIAYELSLQDILVYNTGFEQSESLISSYDISWLLGSATNELVRGIDCPESAVFLSSDIWTRAGKVESLHNNICIFENNGAIPLRRHFGAYARSGYSYYGGITDYHLVVRTIVTLKNNDYVFDYKFYTNGVIEAKVYVTGYVLATFRLPEEQQFGSVIHDDVIANVHQHAFNYKIDLDIAGTQNRVLTLGLELEEYQESVATKTARKIRYLINKETKDITFDLKSTLYSMIYNTHANGEYGSQRAYTIQNKSPISILIGDDQMTSSSKWTKYPFTVTKRKDQEQASTSIYALREKLNPILDFDNYIDNESLVDEDLVSWITVGFNSVPRTEDVPGTDTNLNQASFILSPHNYLPENPSIHSGDNVFIRPNKDGNAKADVNTYGRTIGTRCVPKMYGPFDYNVTIKN